jgi:ATP-dependent Clp protease ATP-binding subunit ClpC
MFERYSERARRAIFFARDEALRRSAEAIETSDLVLGLTRDPHREGCPFSFLHDRSAEFRGLMDAGELDGEKVVARNIPLTTKAKMALRDAADEADQDGSPSIDADHLFRGILRTDDPTSNKLKGAGWTLEDVRKASKDVKRSKPKMNWFRRRILWRRAKLGLIALAVAAFVVAILYMHFQS